MNSGNERSLDGNSTAVDTIMRAEAARADDGIAVTEPLTADMASGSALSVPDSLRLENQLCFPLYAAAREVVGAYRPLLCALGLTYTQYLVMLALWEHGRMSVGELGAMLLLDSGTLTPLLKRLEACGLLRRERSERDEREVLLTLTAQGRDMQKDALPIPGQLRDNLPLSEAEAYTLYRLLYKLLGKGEGLSLNALVEKEGYLSGHSPSPRRTLTLKRASRLHTEHTESQT